MLRRARRFVTRLVELRRPLEEGAEQLIAIVGTAKRVVFEGRGVGSVPVRTVAGIGAALISFPLLESAA